MRLYTQIPESREELERALCSLLHQYARERSFRKAVAEGKGFDNVQAQYFLGLVDDLRFVLAHFAAEQGFEVPEQPSS